MHSPMQLRPRGRPACGVPAALAVALPREGGAKQHRARVEVANEGNTDGLAGYWANSAKGAGSLDGDVSVQEQTLCSCFIFLI